MKLSSKFATCLDVFFGVIGGLRIFDDTGDALWFRGEPAVTGDLGEIGGRPLGLIEADRNRFRLRGDLGRSLVGVDAVRARLKT